MRRGATMKVPKLFSLACWPSRVMTRPICLFRNYDRSRSCCTTLWYCPSSILSLRYRAFYYYAVYFLGVIELSSPFLAVVDAARDYPKIAEKYPITNEVCRVMFAIVFYIVRIFGWFPVSYCFWRDALYLLFNSDAAMHTMPKWVPAFWLFTHGFLTCLQVCVLCLIPFRRPERVDGVESPRRRGDGAGRPTFDRHAGVVGLPHPPRPSTPMATGDEEARKNEAKNARRGAE